MGLSVRRQHVTAIALAMIVYFAQGSRAQQVDSVDESGSYNVLFIAVDDLNDWVGALRGHPQAYTPNLDRLLQTEWKGDKLDRILERWQQTSGPPG